MKDEMKKDIILEENKNQMLKDEELEEVAGGVTINGHNFTGHVTKYKGVIGRAYYVTFDGTDDWWAGRLKKSYEEHYILWTTKRMHVFMRNPVDSFYDEKVCGDDVTLYTTMDGVDAEDFVPYGWPN